MKKIFILAVSAVLLAAGCQKTEIQNEAKTPIGFSSQMGKLTKAPDAGSEVNEFNLQQQGFHVWGFFATQNDLNYSVGYKYLDNIFVKYEGTEWLTNETYYWPGKGKELDIYAISSWDEDYSLAYATQGETPTCNVSINSTDRIVTISNFDVDEDADNDLMVAAMIKQDQDDDKFVRPAFEHALTKVLLNFQKKDNAKVYIESATTSSIPSQATLTVTNVPVENNIKCTQKFSWAYDVDTKGENITTPYVATNKLEKKTLTSTATEKFYDEEGKEITTKFTAVELTNEYQLYGSWLLLPQGKSTEQQDFTEMNANDYYLTVVYYVDGQKITQQFDLTANGKIKAWQRNQQITYNVSISPDTITFDPEVTDWTSKEKPSKDEQYYN